MDINKEVNSWGCDGNRSASPGFYELFCGPYQLLPKKEHGPGVVRLSTCLREKEIQIFQKCLHLEMLANWKLSLNFWAGHSNVCEGQTWLGGCHFASSVWTLLPLWVKTRVQEKPEQVTALFRGRQKVPSASSKAWGWGFRNIHLHPKGN